MFGVCDDHRVGGHQIRVVERDAPGLHVHADLLDTVAKIVRHIDLVEIVGDLVVVDPRIQCQLVDQRIHVIGFVVDRPNILLLLLRRVGHTVHKPLHISLDRGDRRLEVVGDIGDQLAVLPLPLQLLLLGLLEPQAHVLIVLVQISDLPLLGGLQPVVQVAVPDVVHGDIELVDGIEEVALQPSGQKDRRKQKDHDHRDEHAAQKLP